MSNPWFRMYSEFAHDPKVQMLSEVMQRRYIMLMCMRCSELLVTLHETEIAFHMRISDAELAETKALFVQRGFIDADWEIVNWEKRQYSSDSSAERVARHRAKKKQESNGACNVTETKSNGLDTDTDTDTEHKKQNPSAQSVDCRVEPIAEVTEPIRPKQKRKPTAEQEVFVLPDWVPADAWAGYVEMRKKKPMTAFARRLVIAELQKLNEKGHDIASVLSQSIRNNWTDVYPLKPQNNHHQSTQVVPGQPSPSTIAAMKLIREREARNAQ